jgi:transposase
LKHCLTEHAEMNALTSGLPESVGAALRNLFHAAHDENAALRRKVVELERVVLLREEQLRMARIEKYGPRGEKLSAAQMQLLDLEPGVHMEEVAKEAALPDAEKEVAPEPAPAAAATAGPKVRKRAAYSKAHPGRGPLPAHLPRREVIIPCEEAPDGELVGYEVREELVIKPAEFIIDVIKREKRIAVSGDNCTIITAAMPPRILEKSQLGDSVIVELLVRKYCDHLPAYRQRAIWQRDHGFSVNDLLLTRSILKAGDLLQPLARVIGRELKKGSLIQADETRVPVLQQDGKGRNDTAWFWQYSDPGGLVYFDYQDSRSRAGPKAFLHDYAGILQSDGYEVYTDLVRDIHAHAGCWAHARRKFDAARKAAPKEVPCRDSQEILDAIAFLYLVEKEAREKKLDAAARQQHREARGIAGRLEALKQKIISVRSRVLPATALGRACDYAIRQWTKLEVYSRDGRVEIDNNWCENAMRPIALGRKNWMHLGSQESGPRVAAIMTVIASAQRLGLNVREYLAAVLPKLADPRTSEASLAELLPGPWQAARAGA